MLHITPFLRIYGIETPAGTLPNLQFTGEQPCITSLPDVIADTRPLCIMAIADFLVDDAA